MKNKRFLGFIALFLAMCSVNTSCSSSSDDTPPPPPTPPVVVIPEPGEDDVKPTADSKYEHKVLVEDFTGTWCGWCPRVAHAIEESEKLYPESFVAIALHNGDNMEYKPQSVLANALWNKFSIPANERGYPFCTINRKQTWTYPEPSFLDDPKKLKQESSNIGIRFSSVVTNTNASVEANIAFSEDMENVSYVVFILESGLIAKQANYTDYYTGKGNITNFVHNHVVLAASKEIKGEAIASENSKKGKIATFSNLAFTYKGKDAANMSVAVAVFNAAGDCINVQIAPANTTRGYKLAK
ncbi:Omp28-related outer membrane protein [Flavobacterium sp. HSC-61S13]|uniref:Omp28-related outer membrane protein n=1 Tax=Flavobacterium sp. HSC-61S13 TaxID=2910963 RepID=UPI00209E664C|nr:Omp28-related outer membrane protein [Flavobacterium sp. HSC-61S13]MCP1997127.1 thiol-disulfide isomerase/thioredoxin [Flavobacterium sp. HSC-61S13]